MPQETDGAGPTYTLGCFDHQAVLFPAAQELPEIFFVDGVVPAGDQAGVREGVKAVSMLPARGHLPLKRGAEIPKPF